MRGRHIWGVMDFTVATVLPLLALAAAAMVLPRALMRLFPDTLAGLARALLLSAVLMIAGSAALFAFLYAGRGVPAEAVAGGVPHFLGLGVRSALVWGPFLALSGIGLGIAVERRRGERMAAREPD